VVGHHPRLDCCFSNVSRTGLPRQAPPLLLGRVPEEA
jgi:hypothetical protein